VKDFKIDVKYLTLLGLFVLLTGSLVVADSSATWGVETGDTYEFWIDKVEVSELGDTNLALILGDSNRSILVVFTEVSENLVNYTLVATNGSTILPNQVVTMDNLDIGLGVSLVFPSGTFPMALPLSVDDQSDYLEYLSATGNGLGPIVEGFLGTFNLPGEITIRSDYTSTLFVLNATLVVETDYNLDLNSTGISDIIDTSLFNSILTNISIAETSISAEIAYNATDGILQYLQLGFVGTFGYGENEPLEIDAFASIIRIGKLSLEELISKANDSPWDFRIIGLGMIPIIIHRRRATN
jgi:hypothetical protein